MKDPREATINAPRNNRITGGPGMVNSLDEQPVHSVNASPRFNPEVGASTAQTASYNGYDKIENENGLTQLDSEETALAALRAYAQPGVTFDVDKLIVAAAAFKFHSQA
ncbi:hypothetical protein D3C71_1361890 [compost metagenome]